MARASSTEYSKKRHGWRKEIVLRTRRAASNTPEKKPPSGRGGTPSVCCRWVRAKLMRDLYDLAELVGPVRLEDCWMWLKLEWLGTYYFFYLLASCLFDRNGCKTTTPMMHIQPSHLLATCQNAVETTTRAHTNKPTG